MPIRSPRLLYRLNAFSVLLDDNPDAIDEAPLETVDGNEREMYANIKKGIGDYLGLEPVPFNDPFMTGIFGGHGLNAGASYRKRLGGFKVASYKLISKSLFEIEEEYYDEGTETYITGSGFFRTMSIGLSKGHTVNEFINWMLGWDNLDNVAAVVTPAGRRIDTTLATTNN